VAEIGVIFGGLSPEHDISVLSGLQAARVLQSSGHRVTCLFWSKTGQWWRVPTESEGRAFLEPKIEGATEVTLTVPGGFSEQRRMRSQALEFDAVVNCCHGGPGEDGSLTALLRLAGVRVTGPAPDGAALAMDKYATAAIAAQIGVDTIPTRLIESAGDLPFPWVVKPRFGGSSLGVTAGVRDLDTAKALAQQGVARAGCLVQPHLEGWIDLNIAVRRTPAIEVSAIERPVRDDAAILDYKAKYLRGSEGMETTPREVPANIPEPIAVRIRSMAVAIVEAFGLTGIPRIDFLWDGADRVLLCEVNSIPGAMGLYLWEAAGVSRAKVLDDLVAEAQRGPLHPAQWSASSDGAALRVANTIAAKLAL
jgi:D-alanine-D-alanine ligase